MIRTTSAPLADFVMAWEGLRLLAYDPGDGVWTIGCGHTEGVCEGLTCTKEQALQWLHDDLDERAQGLSKYMTREPSQQQFDALVSLAYNLRNGVRVLGMSRTMELFNAGNDRDCADRLLMWNKVNGQPWRGLTARRNAERRIYLDGDYSSRP